MTHSKGRKTKQAGKDGGAVRPKKKAKRSNAATKRAEAEIADLIDPSLTRCVAQFSPSQTRESSALATTPRSSRPRFQMSAIPVRGSHEHRYRGSRRGLVTDTDWAQLGKGTQAGVRIAGFQDLITRCTQAVEAETFDSREDAVLYWIGGGLDETGWRDFIAAIRRLIGKVSDFEVESAQRAADGEGALFPTTFGVLGFESPKRSSRKRRKRAKAKSKKKAGR